MFPEDLGKNRLTDSRRGEMAICDINMIELEKGRLGQGNALSTVGEEARSIPVSATKPVPMTSHSPKRALVA